jgi:ATP dependent DNA ligase domain/HEAT repeats
MTSPIASLAVFDLLRRRRHGDDVILCAFDLLDLDGQDMRRAPLEERKAVLAKLLHRTSGGIVYNEHYEADGAIIYKHACALGCEGIVSKRLGSPYRAGRADCWIKVKNACALAAEVGRRRLGDAVTALVALCNRFVGFGVDCSVPEQVAALEALGAIGGLEASRSVSQMIVKGIVQGPNLAAAATAASRLRVVLPPDVALPLLRHASPSVRAAACACVRAGGDIVATLIELLTDLNGEVATAAACALGEMGRLEARDPLKRYLCKRRSNNPSLKRPGIAVAPE